MQTSVAGSVVQTTTGMPVSVWIIGQLIVVAVAIIGWYVGFRNACRLQAEEFRRQLIDRARVGMTSAIMQYLSWLNSFRDRIVGATELVRSIPFLAGDHAWLRSQLQFLVVPANAAGADFFGQLVEHKYVLPETMGCLQQIRARSSEVNQLANNLNQWIAGMAIAASQGRAPGNAGDAITDFPREAERIAELILLLDDLREAVNCYCLALAVGKGTPEQVPKDSSVPRIVLREGKFLDYVPPASPGASSQPPPLPLA